MRVSFKLIASYVGIAAVIAILGLYFHYTEGLIEQKLVRLKQVAVIGIVDSAAMNEAIHSAHLTLYRHFARNVLKESGQGAGNGAPLELTDEFDRQLVSFQRSLERSLQAHWFVQSSSSQSEPDGSLPRLKEAFQAHREMLKTVTVRLDDQPEEARRFLKGRVETHLREDLLPAIQAYEEHALAEFTRDTQAVVSQLKANQFRRALLSLGAVLAAIVVGLCVSGSIVRPLRKLTTAAREIGKGNFAAEGVEVDTQDELGVLGRAFTRMREELQATMVSRDHLEASLEEREVLLREIHHRVKNNLQIISSFLRLQAAQTGDPALERLLGESRNRVWAMAHIHEQLHRSDDLANIDIAGYVRDLCANIAQSHEAGQSEVRIDVEVDPVRLPLDVAIPCGMIFNELISNALKHAFPEAKPQRRIRVVYRAEEGLHRLGVHDNGQGAGDADWQHGESLGLKIVNALAKQLQGTINVQTNGGTSIIVEYPAQPEGTEGHE